MPIIRLSQKDFFFFFEVVEPEEKLSFSFFWIVKLNGEINESIRRRITTEDEGRGEVDGGGRCKLNTNSYVNLKIFFFF